MVLTEHQYCKRMWRFQSISIEQSNSMKATSYNVTDFQIKLPSYSNNGGLYFINIQETFYMQLVGKSFAVGLIVSL